MSGGSGQGGKGAGMGGATDDPLDDVGRFEAGSFRVLHRGPPGDRGAMTEHRLEGLRADNLLAFLALLGLMRALDAARPDWRARCHWSGPEQERRRDWRPHLTLAEPVSQEEVAEAAAEGCRILAPAFDFPDGWKNVKGAPSEYRAWAETLPEIDGPALRLAVDLRAALATDGALRRDGGIESTPLAFMAGQGHQHFLERLRSVGRDCPDDLPDRLATAIFQSWTRQDDSLTFRWDPEEDRRYALRDRDPSGDGVRTVYGANRLAVLGLASASVMPGPSNLRCSLATRKRGEGWMVRWPLWPTPTGLAGVTAMLRSANTGPAIPSVTARRIQVGKYFNVQPGEIAWSATPRAV